MVELRKRPARAAPIEQASRPAKKAAGSATATATKKAALKKTDAGHKVPVPEEAAGAEEKPAVPASEKAVPKNDDDKAAAATTAKSGPKAGKTQGDAIDLSSFGGEVETHDGKKVTLKHLVDESKSGVVIFTYPKASTPGCTTQACAFRDGHATLTSTGFTIYGLSGDSPKSNTNFKTKQNLPYTLLCNPSFSLIGAIGLQQGADKRTKRGVWAVDKQGKVLLAFAGGPIPTVDAAKKLVDEHK